MEAGTATQLITVAATLSGVVLTLIANAYLERRRARDARELESLHLSSEHAKCLADPGHDPGSLTAGQDAPASGDGLAAGNPLGGVVAIGDAGDGVVRWEQVDRVAVMVDEPGPGRV